MIAKHARQELQRLLVQYSLAKEYGVDCFEDFRDLEKWLALYYLDCDIDCKLERELAKFKELCECDDTENERDCTMTFSISQDFPEECPYFNFTVDVETEPGI